MGIVENVTPVIGAVVDATTQVGGVFMQEPFVILPAVAFVSLGFGYCLRVLRQAKRG